LVVNAAVLGVNHLQRSRAEAHLAITAQPHPARESGGLRRVEMKKPQHNGSGAVTQPAQQHTPPAELDVADLYLALNHRLIADAQCADGHNTGTILVTQWDVEQ
jgi:hypothetical protein